jgi:hypothetical protein
MGRAETFTVCRSAYVGTESLLSTERIRGPEGTVERGHTFLV